MLFFIYGNDSIAKKKTKEQIMKSFEKEDTSLVNFDDTNITVVNIQEYIFSNDLFGKKFIVIVDNAFLDEEVEDFAIKNAKEIKDSENIFIWSEIADKGEGVKALKKNAEKFFEHKLTKKEEKKFNVFALTDAFANRDKKSAWALWQASLASGAAPEQLHGILFWKVKTMLATNSIGKFKKEELKNISSELINLFHKSRTTGFELETLLEQFILETL